MALTVNDRFTVVEGPIKREAIFVTSSNTDNDTVESRLQNPKYTRITGEGGDPTPSDVAVSASGKTLTVENPDAADYVIEVWGF